MCNYHKRPEKKKIISPLPKMLKNRHVLHKRSNTTLTTPQKKSCKSAHKIVKFTALNKTRKQLKDKQNLRYDKRGVESETAGKKISATGNIFIVDITI